MDVTPVFALWVGDRPELASEWSEAFLESCVFMDDRDASAWAGGC